VCKSSGNVKKTWAERNRQRIAANSRIRRETDLSFAIAVRLRTRLARALRTHQAAQGESVTTSMRELLGCTVGELVAYLESKFLAGMSWENRKLWHIDHIRPLASFDLTDLEQRQLIDFINRSFRDVADGDYISARVCYQSNLKQQFLWASLQAVEKYLKAILLYNDRSTKRLSHDLEAAYERLQEIADIRFDIPKDVEEFIRYLDSQGANRYFEYPYFATGNELLLLDKTVWHLRRYCQFFSRHVNNVNDREVDWFEVQLKSVHDPRYKKRPNTFKISGGFLEKVADDKWSELRPELVWKNFWYGTYTKQKIRNVIFRSGAAHPAHFLHPEIFEELDKLVTFSKAVREYFLRKKSRR
jgi:HEPN domain-containing protein